MLEISSNSFNSYNNSLSYIIIRSQRKTLCMSFKDNKLIIKAPLQLNEKYILDWVKSKNTWIVKQQQKYEYQLLHKNNFTIQYKDGSYIPYMGGKIKLIIYDNFNYNFKFDGNNLYILEKLCNEKSIKVWYKQQANILYTQLLNYWQHKMQVKIYEFKLGNGIKKLGYCTKDKIISISWQLILQPLYVIEYVIIHELAHLIHFNHSKEFWQLVEYYCKDYKLAKQYLKQKGMIAI